MKQLKISTKIGLLTLMLAIAGIGVSIFLLTRFSNTRNDYEELRTEIIEPRGTARMLEIAFRKQVQEWKNILLRADEVAERENLKAKWSELEPKVRELAQTLTGASDPPTHAAAVSFTTDYDALMRDEHAALGELDKGAAAVDKLVRGRDRSVVEKIAGVNDALGKLGADGEKRVDDAGRAAQHQSIILMVIAYLGLAIAAFFVARSIIAPLTRLGAAVARISDADAGRSQVRGRRHRCRQARRRVQVPARLHRRDRRGHRAPRRR